MITTLKSEKKEVKIGIDRPFVIIGEKINPTGHKKLAAALTEGNLRLCPRDRRAPGRLGRGCAGRQRRRARHR